ncbi:YkvI family membrane protein [Sphingomonas alpina]|uniref:Membrane protein YkvI n=1 Tax=Sphingomonas alpina TaxID=653931 RepID=A0A7H0LIS9_9SPHN|nr:hypothetical protein [Sphingomonas alpina]QNQ09582.1 hypothetical protein H3Z74_23640 [Sphingomonas alpina]
MIAQLRRLVVPGLVIQAVLVGGGYATGRELVEFFLAMGPASGLAGMALTALMFSVSAMIAFELARRFQAHDYNSFMRLLLGRWRWLFELGYLATLTLVLAIVSAASSELLHRLCGLPPVIGGVLFMLAVAMLVFFGNRMVERVISAWSIIFYLTYGALFFLVLARFGPAMGTAIASEPLRPGATLWNALSYAGYNVPLVPVLIFVARNFATRREALVAGAITGPLVLLPGFAFLLTLSAFYPAILHAPLPISTVLDRLGTPAITVAIQLVVLGALIKTGVGLLHGFNERLARAALERDRPLPPLVRPAVAIILILVAVYAATAIGLVDLIGTGYRYSALYFLAVFITPLLTIGLWRLLRPGHGEP